MTDIINPDLVQSEDLKIEADLLNKLKVRSSSPHNLYRILASNVLYVGNLNRRIGEDEFRDLFGRFGKIERVQLIKDPSTK